MAATKVTINVSKKLNSSYSLKGKTKVDITGYADDFEANINSLIEVFKGVNYTNLS